MKLSIMEVIYGKQLLYDQAESKEEIKYYFYCTFENNQKYNKVTFYLLMAKSNDKRTVLIYRFNDINNNGQKLLEYIEKNQLGADHNFYEYLEPHKSRARPNKEYSLIAPAFPNWQWQMFNSLYDGYDTMYGDRMQAAIKYLITEFWTNGHFTSKVKKIIYIEDEELDDQAGLALAMEVSEKIVL